MNVLVVGGAGFLGVNLIRYVLSRGDAVTSFDVAPFDYPERSLIKIETGDVRDQKLLARAMRGIDVVVHAAAALPLNSDAEIRSVNVEGTMAVLRAAREAGITRVIYISSTAVYGIPDHHPVYESDPLQGVGSYGESKIAAEAVCATFRAEGMCVPILRPKSFVGPERLGVFALLYEWAAEGRSFPLIGNGSNRYQLLDVGDLCRAVYECATADAARVNDTFNVGAEKFGSMREDYQSVLDRAGYGRRVIGFPAVPVIALLRLFEMLGISPLYKWVYETAAKDSFVSTEKIRRVLGFSPRYSNTQALLRNFEWYMANRGRLHAAPGVTHRVPWKQGVLGIIKYLF